MVSRSRLYRTQTRRYTRQAILFSLLTISLILIIIFLGIPLLVKGAAFLLDLRSANTTPQNPTSATPPPQLLPMTEATNSATITISGYAQAGDEIILYQNNQSKTSQVSDQDGNFAFSRIILEPGENRFWTTAKNNQSQESQLSNQIFIIFDQDPPKLNVTSPAPDSKFFGSQEKVLTIQGETEPDTTLYLNDRLINITTDGKFSYRFSLSEGDNLLHFKAADPAGNVTETELKVSFIP